MLTVRDVSKRFGTTQALADVTLTVGDGEIVALMGPSGCGKSTLLRVIAGLELPDAGDVFSDGMSIAAVPAHRRGFALMFQDFALFPHLTVYDNVAFGLRMKGMDARQIRTHVEEQLDRVNLAGFGSRDVAQLSGGEKQRVALARSLAPQPRLVLLDEPLGSLDAALRAELAGDIRDALRRSGTAALFVTHDRSEAFAIADRVGVMSNGRLLEIAPPQVLYFRPRFEFTAQFLRLTNILGLEKLGQLGVQPRADASVSNQWLVHPLGIRFSEDGHLTARVIHRSFAGNVWDLTIELTGGIRLTFVSSAAETVPGAGEWAGVSIDPAWLVPLES
jgi:ABC-type Fe3+/spermidine/putrescine transport system ATPase subunit